LRDHRKSAGQKAIRREDRAGAGGKATGVDHANAVWTEQSHAASASGMHNGGFPSLSLRSGVAKATGENCGTMDPSFRALADNIEYVSRWTHEVSVLDTVRCRHQVRVASLAKNLLPIGIDWDNAPLVAVLAQELLRSGAALRCIGGSADESNGRRVEQCIRQFLVHGVQTRAALGRRCEN